LKKIDINKIKQDTPELQDMKKTMENYFNETFEMHNRMVNFKTRSLQELENSKLIPDKKKKDIIDTINKAFFKYEEYFNDNFKPELLNNRGILQTFSYELAQISHNISWVVEEEEYKNTNEFFQNISNAVIQGKDNNIEQEILDNLYGSMIKKDTSYVDEFGDRTQSLQYLIKIKNTDNITLSFKKTGYPQDHFVVAINTFDSEKNEWWNSMRQIVNSKNSTIVSFEQIKKIIKNDNLINELDQFQLCQGIYPITSTWGAEEENQTISVEGKRIDVVVNDTKTGLLYTTDTGETITIDITLSKEEISSQLKGLVISTPTKKKDKTKSKIKSKTK